MRQIEESNVASSFDTISSKKMQILKRESSMDMDNRCQLQLDYYKSRQVMPFMEYHQNNWQHDMSAIEESSSEAILQIGQSFNRNEWLAEARLRLISFIDDLQQHRRTQLRSDILQHCEQINRNKKIVPSFISEESVMRLATCRIQKMIKNKKIKKNWSEEDVKILVWVISKYCDRHLIQNLEKDLEIEDWENIAQLIPGVNANSCMFKWLSIKKTNLSNCSWSQEESQLLRQIVCTKQGAGSFVNNFNAFNWKMVAEQLFFRNICSLKVFRSAKQCREHWNCFLNPKLKKGPWLVDEDIQLLTHIKGNKAKKKWSQIVYFFEGRTENALKNRYTLLIDKQKKVSKSKTELALIEDCLQKCFEEKLKDNVFEHKVVMGAITEEKQEIENENGYFEAIEQIEWKDFSENQRSEQNTVSSPSPTPKTSSGNQDVKIHYLTSSQQLQFLEFMRSRGDMKRCCLKNGKQFQEC